MKTPIPMHSQEFIVRGWIGAFLVAVLISGIGGWEVASAAEPPRVIDFTRYDLAAREPPDPRAGRPIRNWSLMNRINQKQTRPQDKPVPLAELPEEDRKLIVRRYPELAPAARP